MSQTLAEWTVYNSNFRKKTSLFEAFSNISKDIWAFRSLIWRYFKRDFVASYQQSLLGFLWKLILPLVPLTVYIILQELGVFSAALDMPRALYVVIGMTFWQFFSATLMTTVNRLDSQSNLVKKVRVPLIVIYLTGIGQIFFDFLVRMALLIALLFFYNIEPNWSWLFLPAMVLPFFIIGFGLGLFLSFFAVFAKDIRNLVTMFISYGIFASSVIFPIPNVSPWNLIIQWNSLHQLIEFVRNALVFGEFGVSLGLTLTLVFSCLLLLFSLTKLYSVEQHLIGGL